MARLAASSRWPDMEPERSSTTIAVCSGRTAFGSSTRGWGLQVEHDGDGVGGLDSDEVDIKMGGDVHGASVLRVWRLVETWPLGGSR